MVRYNANDILGMMRDGTLTSINDPRELLGDDIYSVIPSTQNWSYGSWNLNGGLPAMRRPIVTNSPLASNVVDADFTDTASKATKSAKSGKGGFFSPLTNWFKGINTGNSGWSLTGREGSLGVGNTGGRAGLTIGGKNLGGLATAGAGIYQGIRGFQNLNDLSETKDAKENILNQIRTAAAGNPMLSSYLTDDELATLNKVKRGQFNNAPSNKNSFGDILKGAGTGALTGAAGGLPGIIVGALGGAINGGISSQNEAYQRENATLEGLYNSLANANAQYKRMRIPNYTGLGLQSRYTNQWM